MPNQIRLFAHPIATADSRRKSRALRRAEKRKLHIAPQSQQPIRATRYPARSRHFWAEIATADSRKKSQQTLCAPREYARRAGGVENATSRPRSKTPPRAIAAGSCRAQCVKTSAMCTQVQPTHHAPKYNRCGARPRANAYTRY